MGKFSIPSLTKRQWATAFVIAFADFCSAVCISLQAPFYPAEAERKGATASQYGFVFGCYELTVFLTSPLFGKYLAKLIPKFMLNGGLVVTGVCSILFGVLDKIDDTTAFIGLSFAVRVIEALGSAAFLTAAFAIIAAEFPSSIATTFACLETFFGLGLIVGPTLGGFLFQMGGYMLPFTVLGVLLIAAAFFTYALLPAAEHCDSPQSGGLFRILRIPSILLASFSVFAASTSVGFLSATLEPHLRQFDLMPVSMGLMFVIEGGIYAITAPVWGYLCDRKVQPKIVTLIGSIFIVVGFLLIGPAPFLPLDTTLNLAITGLVIMGFGVGAELVSGFISALQEATFHGFPNNLSTYGLVSGLWTSTFALGAFVGPSLAGILFDQVGFRYSTLFVITTNALLGILVLFFLCCQRRLSPGILAVPEQYQAANYSTLAGEDYGPEDERSNARAKRESMVSSLKDGMANPEWMTSEQSI
ncbi:MFS-type transporter SLC18B1-like [Daphnia pulex]|uniref:MFS-type transporter SLC18B1-like n=1 Tax=Daphnia pulex TaxID=6669 RepID=UPI001EDE298D|nr:MFS-type transporter SLC18B1-like [Daphnia pulex]XP_046648082.1 MFS-type transporter SLC18B1-like [Daphnia pulicaria]